MTAFDQYLHRYAEPEAAALSNCGVPYRWAQVLVIPAYGESPQLLGNLEQFSHTLLILVLNRPDSETDESCNDALRAAVMARGTVWRCASATAVLTDVGDNNHVMLVERQAPLAARQGVGLARKIGCDMALALQRAGAVESDWIHCSDGDATLPRDYFSAASEQVDAVALTYPFVHDHPADARERKAMQRYDEYLRHYVRGLAFAGSPYAFFTLGSCLAVKADAYAKVRGFPKRAGGEDFYLLNKLVKLGAVMTPGSAPIRLSPRLSHRVPFGTGPALRKLIDGNKERHDALFYHPATFENLRVLLRFVEDYGRPGLREHELTVHLKGRRELLAALTAQGFGDFLEHAREHCADSAAFKNQFHQWFDGFRTLKLIRALAQDFGRLTLAEFDEARLD